MFRCLVYCLASWDWFDRLIGSCKCNCHWMEKLISISWGISFARRDCWLSICSPIALLFLVPRYDLGRWSKSEKIMQHLHHFGISITPESLLIDVVDKLSPSIGHSHLQFAEFTRILWTVYRDRIVESENRLPPINEWTWSSHVDLKCTICE